MSLLERPVLFANFSSSDETFSGKLIERIERIEHLLYYWITIHYTLEDCQDPPLDGEFSLFQ